LDHDLGDHPCFSDHNYVVPSVFSSTVVNMEEYLMIIPSIVW
jgi:hypothetical protein